MAVWRTVSAVTDVWFCGECGSRRVSGSLLEGYFCHDCGRQDVGGDDWSVGGPSDGSNSFFQTDEHDPRFDPDPDPRFRPDPEREADSRQQTAPEPERQPSMKTRFVDSHSHLRCACCFELAARCRRTVHLTGRQRCCVACHCSEGRK